MKTTTEKAVADFLRSLRERNSSPHTIKAYTNDLHNFAAHIGSRNPRTIDHLVIRRFLSHLYDRGMSKTSVARSLAAVRSLYRWLAQQGLAVQNPAALVSTPRLPRKTAARSHHRRDELRSRRANARGRLVSRA